MKQIFIDSFIDLTCFKFHGVLPPFKLTFQCYTLWQFAKIVCNLYYLVFKTKEWREKGTFCIKVPLLYPCWLGNIFLVIVVTAFPSRNFWVRGKFQLLTDQDFYLVSLHFEETWYTLYLSFSSLWRMPTCQILQSSLPRCRL